MNKKINFWTNRLIVKTLRVRHITAAYVDGINSPEVNRFLVEVRLRKQTTKGIEDFIKKNLDAPDSLLLGVFIKKSNQLIGTIRISNISYFHYLCSLGICIFDKNSWNQGYALEALVSVVKFIFGTLKLHYIEAGVYKKNQASLNLFKKAGFKIEAFFKNKYRHIDTFSGVYMFGKSNPRLNYKKLKCNRASG